MKILKELRAKLAAEQDKVKLMLAVIDARKDSPVPTDEETAAYDAACDEIRSLKAKIEKFEANKELIVAEALEQSNQEQRQAPVGEQKPIAVTVIDDEKPIFRNLGQQLSAIVMADPANPKRDRYDARDREIAINKLKEVRKRAERAGVELRAPAGASTLVDSDGGYLLQPDVAAGIWEMSLEEGSFAKDCSSTEISTNSQSFKMYQVDETSRADGSRYGGVRAYWVQEADPTTASRPKMKIFQCQLDKIMALGYATNEMLEDADAMSQVMVANFAKEIAFQVDNAIAWGTGAAQPLGVFNSSFKGLLTQNKDSGQATGTFSATNAINMNNLMLPGSLTKCKWYMNLDLRQQLPQMALATGTYSGTLVYMPAGGITGQQYDTLLGHPIVFTEFNSQLSTLGDVLLADFSYYKLITKGGIRSDSSIHVNFLTDEVVFRLAQRVGGKPLIQTSITPYKGLVNHSPFVTLQAR